MRILFDDIALCEDCTILAVNDDASGLTEEREAHCRAGLAKLGPHLVSNFNSENGEGYQEFSMRVCDACKTRLGGSRHRFAILGH